MTQMQTAVRATTRTRPSMGRMGMLIFFGIALPLVAIGVEWATGACASLFYDPMPSKWSAAVMLIVPLANLLFCAGAGNWGNGWRRSAGIANGAALVVAVFYTLLFAPLLPIGALGIIALGLGLLPLSPALSLIATLFATAGLRHTDPRQPSLKPMLLVGLFIGVVCLAAPHLSIAITHHGMALAVSDDPSQRSRGVTMLRKYGDRDLLVQTCIGAGQGNDPLHWILSGDRQMTPEDVRKLYYQVTGETFDRRSAPARARRAFWWNDADANINDVAFRAGFDADLGGELIGRKQYGLGMVESRIDGIVDADQAWSYVEWTMVFQNDDRFLQQEARAQIRLPKGGVVSRLTLWIDGEPREAAFGKKSQVREAYQKVAVVQRRDPVLVTYTGPDRVMMQCFPIPPSGGRMKVRVGITAPAQLEDEDRARFSLPAIVDCNFDHKQTSHPVWLESASVMHAEDAPSMFTSAVDKTGRTALSGDLPPRAARDGAAWTCKRNADAREAWAPDDMDPSRAVVQRIERVAPAPPDAIVIVVDGSAGMDKSLTEIADHLNRLPPTARLCVLVAGDDVHDLTEGMKPITPELLRTVGRRLREFDCEGGIDPLSALCQAIDVARSSRGDGGRDAVVLWIHGTQPYALSSVEPLLQRLERGAGEADGISVPTLAVRNGPSSVADKLGPWLEPLDPAAGIGGAIERASASSDGIKIVREELSDENGASTPGPGQSQASQHVVRLWANDEVTRLLRGGDSGSTSTAGYERAAKLAVDHQLVTAVSGAVVLETQQQYEMAKLQPAEAESTPIVPEPNLAWIVLLSSTVALMARRRRRRPRGQ